VERYWVRYRALQRLSHTFRSTPVLPHVPAQCRAIADVSVHGYHSEARRAGMSAAQARATLQQLVDDSAALLSDSPPELRGAVRAGHDDAKATLAGLATDASAATILAALDQVQARQAAATQSILSYAQQNCPSWDDYLDQVAGYDALGVTPE
jgi:hypothetical protein